MRSFNRAPSSSVFSFCSLQLRAARRAWRAGHDRRSGRIRIPGATVELLSGAGRRRQDRHRRRRHVPVRGRRRRHLRRQRLARRVSGRRTPPSRSARPRRRPLRLKLLIGSVSETVRVEGDANASVDGGVPGGVVRWHGRRRHLRAQVRPAVSAAQPRAAWSPVPAAPAAGMAAAAIYSFSPSLAPDAETYGAIDENKFRRVRRSAALHLLDRRRHGVVRERAALPQRRAAAAGRRRPRRRADQLLPLRLRRPDAGRAVRRHHRARAVPVGQPSQARAHRPAGAAAARGEDAAAQSRVPARRLRLDGAERTAADGEERR